MSVAGEYTFVGEVQVIARHSRYQSLGRLVLVRPLTGKPLNTFGAPGPVWEVRDPVAVDLRLHGHALSPGSFDRFGLLLWRLNELAALLEAQTLPSIL